AVDARRLGIDEHRGRARIRQSRARRPSPRSDRRGSRRQARAFCPPLHLASSPAFEQPESQAEQRGAPRIINDRSQSPSSFGRRDVMYGMAVRIPTLLTASERPLGVRRIGAGLVSAVALLASVLVV